MISVSNAWKEAHKQTLLPEAFVEITLDIVDTPVSATASGTSEASFSNASAIVNNSSAGVDAKYAVLEHNLWALDGTRTIMGTSDDYPGYASADDALGSVTIDVVRTNDNSIPGLTITWSGEYETFATKFTVDVKNDNTTVATTTVTDNASNISVVDLQITQYDSVTITVHEWSHPDHRARIDSVKLGHSIVFGKNEIIGYSQEQSGSPLGTELSKNAIEFEVDNSDGRWNILNPVGLSKYLYERQKLQVRYGLQTTSGVEWIRAGVFYLTEWKAPANGITATFSARDAIEFTLNTPYSKPYRKGITTSEVKAFAVKDEAIDSLGNESTGIVLATIPSGTEVKIYEQSFQFTEIYGEDNDTWGWPLYRVEQGWIDARYADITEDTRISVDVQTALESCLPDDIQIFNNIDTNTAPVAITEPSTGEFIQQAAASVVNTMWQDCYGDIRIDTIHVLPPAYVISLDVSYYHPEVELAKPLKEVIVVGRNQWHDRTKTNTFAVNATGETITVDNPYVWHTSAANKRLADKYIAWWEHREVVSGEFRADPRLELFDCVEVETQYGVLSPVMITYLKYTYNGAFRAVYEGKVVDESFN